MSDSLLTSAADSSDIDFESAIRPKTLDEFVGQQRVRDQIQLLIKAASIQNRTPDHILLAGPPGLGKTTLAMIIARESGRALRMTSGPAIQHAGDLAAVLSSLSAGELLFIDEIHRMSRSAEELLYLAMEDFRVDVMVGKGSGASIISLELEPFTLVAATTRSGMLPNPLRDRFGFTTNLDFYSPEELHQVVTRAAQLMNVDVIDDGLGLIASRSRGTPRVANRLLRRVRDYALVHNAGRISKETIDSALDLYEVDELGLDRLDRAVLSTLITRFAGRPVGLSTLAIALGEEQETIESVVEPYLLRAGLLARTARGRVATELAYSHLGIKAASTDQGLFD